jgi:hypothetical protein
MINNSTENNSFFKREIFFFKFCPPETLIPDFKQERPQRPQRPQRPPKKLSIKFEILEIPYNFKFEFLEILALRRNLKFVILRNTIESIDKILINSQRQLYKRNFS